MARLTPTQVALHTAWVATAGGYGPAHATTLAAVRVASGQPFPRLWTLHVLLERGLLVKLPVETPPHSLIRTLLYATPHRT